MIFNLQNPNAAVIKKMSKPWMKTYRLLSSFRDYKNDIQADTHILSLIPDCIRVETVSHTHTHTRVHI